MEINPVTSFPKRTYIVTISVALLFEVEYDILTSQQHRVCDVVFKACV